MRSRVEVLIAAIAILALTAAHYRSVYDLGFLSHDTIPIVASSALDSPGDVLRVVTETHVPPPYWSQFYRPLQKLTFSLDHALFGFDARGYHATSALLLAALGGLLFAFTRRLCGAAAVYAPWFAVAVFFVHPVHVEVHAALERRGEVLCGVFLLWALYVQLSPRTLALRRPALLPALLTLLAVASKETAIVLPPLIGLLVWLNSPRERAWERFGHGVVASLGPVVAVGLAAAARLGVLGTVGGGHKTAGLSALSNVGELSNLLLFPQPVLSASIWIPWLPLVGGVGIAGVAVAVAWTRQVDGRLRRDATAVLYGAAFTVIMLLLHAYTGQKSRWYLMLPALGWGLAMGPLGDALVHAARRMRALWLRALAGAALAVLGVFLVAHAKLSPMVYDYVEWRRGAEIRDAYLGRLVSRIRDVAPGRVLRVEPYPNWVRYDPRLFETRPTVYTAGVMRRDSLEAWLGIVLPEKNIRVLRQRDAPFDPHPDGLVLVTERHFIVLRP